MEGSETYMQLFYMEIKQRQQITKNQEANLDCNCE